MKREELPIRARVFWWLMVRTERASGWLRRAVISIWRSHMDRKRPPARPGKLWEAWYLGEDKSCQRCARVEPDAALLERCPACGYGGKEISNQ